MKYKYLCLLISTWYSSLW